MPRRQSVKIRIGDSERTFETKAKLKAECKAMLARYHNGDTINEEDSEFLRGLLERHPEAVQKIGCGVKRFFRGGTGHSTDCFWLEREDGSRTDFSYPACVNARGPSPYQEFAEACREAVQPYLKAAKKDFFETHGNAEGKVQCEISNEMVALNESHLDHKKPMTFQVIVQTFIAAHNIEIRREMLSTKADWQFVTTFVDKDLEQKLCEHHKRASKDNLRIIKARENLSLGGSERITKPKRPVVLASLMLVLLFAMPAKAQDKDKLTAAQLAQIGANAALSVPANVDTGEWISARVTVQTIAKRLMESPAPAPRAVIQLVNSTDDDLNADSTLGTLTGDGPAAGMPVGIIKVNYALVRFLGEDTSELAAVIAHELGHVYDAQHGGCQFEPHTKEQQRACEATADRLSLVFLLAAHYDPYGVAGAFGKMMMFSGGATVTDTIVGRFLSNHPVSLDRINNLRGTLIQLCQTVPNGCRQPPKPM
jgi:Zn-dependent protease with chaperone function